MNYVLFFVRFIRKNDVVKDVEENVPMKPGPPYEDQEIILNYVENEFVDSGMNEISQTDRKQTTVFNIEKSYRKEDLFSAQYPLQTDKPFLSQFKYDFTDEPINDHEIIHNHLDVKTDGIDRMWSDLKPPPIYQPK